MIQTPKHYVVTYELVNGEVRTEPVVAYEIIEALTQVNIRLIARGLSIERFTDVTPDLKAHSEYVRVNQSALTADIKTIVRDIMRAGGSLLGAQGSGRDGGPLGADISRTGGGGGG